MHGSLCRPHSTAFNRTEPLTGLTHLPTTSLPSHSLVTQHTAHAPHSHAHALLIPAQLPAPLPFSLFVSLGLCFPPFLSVCWHVGRSVVEAEGGSRCIGSRGESAAGGHQSGGRLGPHRSTAQKGRGQCSAQQAGSRQHWPCQQRQQHTCSRRTTESIEPSSPSASYRCAASVCCVALLCRIRSVCLLRTTGTQRATRAPVRASSRKREEETWIVCSDCQLDETAIVMEIAVSI